MEVYINGTYTQNNYVAGIRSYCREKEAKDFLLNKQISMEKIHHIWYRMGSSCQLHQKQNYSRKKTLLKFVHRWLASRNKNYGQKLMCPNCRQQESTSMDHDHFLTCSSSGRRKQLRLNLLNTLLQYFNTPPVLSKLIVNGIQPFYNSQLNNIHASDFKAINN